MQAHRVSVWRWTDCGWRHRPWWKVAINTVLRAMQPRVRRKLVIASLCIGGDDASRVNHPTVIGCALRRVMHTR